MRRSRLIEMLMGRWKERAVVCPMEVERVTLKMMLTWMVKPRQVEKVMVRWRWMDPEWVMV